MVIRALLSLCADGKERKDDRMCSVATLRHLGLNEVLDYSGDQSMSGEAEGAAVL